MGRGFCPPASRQPAGRRAVTALADIHRRYRPFLDAGWAEKAAALGWGPLDCSVRSGAPFARIDHAGLLWLLNGGTLVELGRQANE